MDPCVNISALAALRIRATNTERASAGRKEAGYVFVTLSILVMLARHRAHVSKRKEHAIRKLTHVFASRDTMVNIVRAPVVACTVALVTRAFTAPARARAQTVVNSLV